MEILEYPLGCRITELAAEDYVILTHWSIKLKHWASDTSHHP